MTRPASKQRKFSYKELDGIARQCLEVISKDQDVFDFLVSKGAVDPVNEWYDIRRWMKSNAPQLYVQIPMKLKLELPVKRVNPKKTEEEPVKNEPEEAKKPETKENQVANEPEEAPKKRGRPPKAKTEEKPAQEKKTQNMGQKAKGRVKISQAQGSKLTYTLKENGQIEVHVVGFDNHMTFTPNELRAIRNEIPEVLKAFAV